MATELNNQRINTPVVVADVMNGQTIATLQPVYPLSEADFVRLKGGTPVTAAMAVMIFSGVVGYAIGLSSKLEPLIVGDHPLLSISEIKTIAGWSAISLAIYGIGFFLPNERSSVMKKLSNHFKATKSSTHIIGDGK